jgi:hypothetical protein
MKVILTKTEYEKYKLRRLRYEGVTQEVIDSLPYTKEQYVVINTFVMQMGAEMKDAEVVYVPTYAEYKDLAAKNPTAGQVILTEAEYADCRREYDATATQTDEQGTPVFSLTERMLGNRINELEDRTACLERIAVGNSGTDAAKSALLRAAVKSVMAAWTAEKKQEFAKKYFVDPHPKLVEAFASVSESEGKARFTFNPGWRLKHCPCAECAASGFDWFVTYSRAARIHDAVKAFFVRGIVEYSRPTKASS